MKLAEKVLKGMQNESGQSKDMMWQDWVELFGQVNKHLMASVNFAKYNKLKKEEKRLSDMLSDLKEIDAAMSEMTGFKREK